MNALEELALRVTQAAVHLLWIGALVALGVLVVERLVVRSAAGRHAAHLLGLVLIIAALPLALLVAPSGPSARSPDPGAGEGEPALRAVSSEAMEALEAASQNPSMVADRTDDGPASSVPVKAAAGVGAGRAGGSPPDGRWETLAPWVAGGYAIGLVLMALRLCCGFAGSMQLRRRSERVQEDGDWPAAMRRMADAVGVRIWPTLHWSREVAAPVVMGFVKPAVLLPMALASRLSPAQVEAVLAHELAHLHRRDTWAVVVQRIAETVLFFHPAVWWMSRRMESAREEACDDLVVAAGCDPADYAEALLICSECRLERSGVSAKLASGLAATGRDGAPLRRRVLRLLGQGDRGSVRLGRISWVLGVLAIGGAALAVGVGNGREDLADFDFGDPPGSYEKGIRVADRHQRFEAGGILFQAGPLQWHPEGFQRLAEERQGPGEELFLNLGTSGGYEIVEIRLMDHATRELIHSSKWQRPGDHTKDFVVGRIGTTNWLRMKEMAGTFPDKIDVWLRIVRQDQGRVIILDGREGASARVGDSELVITKLLPGSMNGRGTSGGEMLWDLGTVHGEDRELTLNLENRGRLLEGRHHLVAIKKDGSRHPMDHRHFRDFGRMGRKTYVQMDVALADLDHFELIPFKERHKFFFNGLEVPREELPELSRHDRESIERGAGEVTAGELAEEDFLLQLKHMGPEAVRGLIPLMRSGGTDVLAIEGVRQFIDQPAVVNHIAGLLRGLSGEAEHRSPNTRHGCLILLGEAGDRRHVDLAAGFLETNPIAAMHALGKMGGDQARDHLIAAFDRVPTDKWWLLADQLKGFGDAAAVPELKRRLAMVELPPSERFPRRTVGAFTEAITALSGREEDSTWRSWQQGQRFVYPFDGPGSPKTFSVEPARDHHVQLPEVDPQSAAGREAIWKAMTAATEGPGFTLDGDEVVLFHGLRAMPLWQDGAPYPTRLHDWLEQTSHAELLEKVERDGMAGRLAVPGNGLLLAMDPSRHLYVLNLDKRTADFQYGVNFRSLDPLRQLVKAPVRKSDFTEWSGCTLHDLESGAKNGAFNISRGHMLTMDEARWREPGTDAVLVADFAPGSLALGVSGAEEFVLVKVDPGIDSSDLVQRLVQARENPPELDGHETIEPSGAIFHRFDGLEPGSCFGIAVRMTGGLPVAGVLEVREVDRANGTLKTRHRFLRTEHSRAVFAVPGDADAEPDGVVVRWESVEYQHGDDDHPHPVVVLGYSAYNRGPHRLHLPESGDYHQVEVDGRWYEWVDPRVFGAGDPEVTKGTPMLDFDPGDSQLKQGIRLAGNWRAIPAGKEHEYAQRQLSGFAVLPGDYGEELVLEPGKHDVRIAVLCQPARAGLYRMIRGVSEPKEVNVTDELETAAGGPDPEDLEAVFRFVERFARLPEGEQANGLAGFYECLSARTLSPMVEMILSSYPHDILEPNRDGDPYDGNTAQWARQLEETAKEQSIEGVSARLGRPVWIRVATRARALQVFERHAEATAKLIAGDLDSGDKVAIDRAAAIIHSLQLRGFSERLLELWLAEGVGSQAARGTLVFLRDPAIVGQLRERVREDPAFIKRCSGLFQGALAGKEADPMLVDLLDSPDAEVRYHAADALQECRDPDLGPLVASLAGEGEGRFRLLAARMVSRLPDDAFKSCREDLLKLLNDEDDEVKFQSVWSFARHRDLAAGPMILEALRSEMTNEQFKVWVMQALGALTDKAWNYDMHRWGPEGRGNREAIERIEAWLIEEDARGSDRGAGRFPEGLEFLAGIPEFAELRLDMNEARLREIIGEHELEVSVGTSRDGASTDYTLVTPRGETVIVMFAKGECSGIQRMRDQPMGNGAGKPAKPNPLGLGEAAMVALFQAGKLMEDVATSAHGRILENKAGDFGIDELYEDYKTPEDYVNDPLGGKLELRHHGEGEQRRVEVWSRGTAESGPLGLAISANGERRWIVPDPAWEPYLEGRRTAHWLRALQPVAALELPLPEWEDDPLAYGPEVDGLRLAVELVPKVPESGVMRMRCHVRNETRTPIQIAAADWIQHGELAATDSDGREVAVGTTWFSGWPRVRRERVEPGKSVIFEGPTLGLDGAQASMTLKADPGTFSMRLRLSIPDIRMGSIEGVPRARDWQGELESGDFEVRLPPGA